MVFDPATLQQRAGDDRRSASARSWSRRPAARADYRPIPAFRVEMAFAGLRTTSWITDTGEVVREESPLGLMTVRERRSRRSALAVVEPRCRATCSRPPRSCRADRRRHRIDEPRDVRRHAACASTAPTSPSPELQGAGQTVDGDVLELVDRALAARRRRPIPTSRATCAPEPFIESDAPGDSSPRPTQAVAGVDRHARAGRAADARRQRAARQEADRQPAVGARGAAHQGRRLQRAHRAVRRDGAALGIPARIAVGLVYVRGAFYYHAWPEVYIDEGRRPRPVAAGRSDVQPVSRRRDARAAGARRPRQAGGDPAADRPARR